MWVRQWLSEQCREKHILQQTNGVKIAEQFEKKWQFPYCCCALDGKHVAVTCPWNTDSMYINYNGFFSIVLMALVDANYKFSCVDVGYDGISNNASIYNGSELKEGL